MTAADQLRLEGHCALTLSRSSQGRIKLLFRTHTLGLVRIEMDPDTFADLLFGVAETGAAITQVLPARIPSYPKLP